jgi:predicted SAM-dependent methyltransferase
MEKLSARIKDGIKVMLGISIAVTPSKEEIKKTPYCCNVCKRNNVTFNPLPMHYLYYGDKYQCIHNIFFGETLNLLNYTCAYCEAADRDRLHALYIDEFCNTLIPGQKLKLLDIAPYAPFSAYLNKINHFQIRTADLFQAGVDDVVDITKMDIYGDESFDVFICSHVLEHVDDDAAGIKELYRILKKRGWGIAMVPINLELEEDYENDLATTEELRWKHYGHPDHKRFYSKKGFVAKLTQVGFHVLQLDINYFGTEVFEKYGINERSVLYIAQKI